MALTDVAVRNAKPGPKTIRLKDERGLHLEISPKGGKWWRLRYWISGKERLISLGIYPDISLKDARERRDEARKLIANGIDPGRARQDEKSAAEARAAEDANTFEVVARDWHAKQVKAWSEGHAAKVLARMEQHLFPAFGHFPITTLRAPAILPTLREIEAKGHNETAKRLRQYCEAVFAFAISTGIAERNVGADLRGALAPGRVTNRPAIIDPKGVAQLLRAIDGYQGSPVTLAALRLAPLVFVRPGELRQAEWSEIDLDAADGPRWSIPAEKMKMRRNHVVPLSRQAVEIIEDLRSLTGHDRFLFPCNRTKDRCMSNMTLNAALRRLGYEQGEMCAHGFRAMASTLLNEQGWNSDLIERQLAHAERNSIRAAYNRAEYLPERRKMMQAYADHLDKLKAGAKVTPIHATAGD
ncbi:integrase family protein [Solidesulfovibrio fructosivorans JJ]]|uniref:Integrase family protein n=1 Tax=Solidesulfovibrio fructosivorans JJ] TaxID=596151 RepID=E1JUR5_SOLFR|nr:integrase arm-type DNA-binding domain-containing protein [Solidesulfovibrio fructosivorans]EFL51829.1 integrase family protein [Solidesulfovibrio fructosivorans JJ]]